MTPPRLDDQLCFALYAASRAVTRAYGPMLADLGLTYPQFLVMMALWEADGVTVSQLGRRLRLDSGTLTPLLKRLERSGMLRRQRSTEDERRVLVTLTEDGRDLGSRAGEAHRALVCRLADPDERGSVETLRDTLHALTERLSQ